MNRIACLSVQLLILSLSAGFMGLAHATGANPAAAITVHVDQPVGQIDSRIFGHFTEEVLTSYEGGVSSARSESRLSDHTLAHRFAAHSLTKLTVRLK